MKKLLIGVTYIILLYAIIYIVGLLNIWAGCILIGVLIGRCVSNDADKFSDCALKKRNK